MAITIPIISEFNAKGVQKAIRQFRQLETTGQKAQFALRKAAVPATAALAGLATAAVAFGKAAAEDQLAADQLALALRNNTKATDAQIQANEEYISSLSMASAVADDELRPALQKLSVGTRDLGKAQKLLDTALNISAATGVDLVAVSDALAKGYNGNMKALAKLSPQIKKVVKDGASFTDVVKLLDRQFAGANKTFAESAAGGMKRLDIALNETKESIGAALLPVIQAALPFLQKFAEWAQNNPQVFKTVAIAIAAIATSVMALNVAMALNPIGLIVIAVGAVITALVLAYQKFEWFRNGVKTVFNAITAVVERWVNLFIKGINIVIKGLNALPGVSIKPLGEVNFGGGAQTSAGPGFRQFEQSTTFMPPGIAPSIPRRAEGGTTIQVNVNGGDPNAVVQTLRKYVRQTGSLPVRTAPIG